MNVTDTICAVSTPPGVGGIAVVRVSGPDAIAITDRIWQGKSLTAAATHTAHLGYVLDSEGLRLDEAVATVYQAPGSYTGDDVVEISVHGSTYVQRALLESLINAGARIAEAGEFTRRAYASGKIDLPQAEAVADIISSQNKAAQRIALSQMRGTYSTRLSQLREQIIHLASLLELELDFAEEEVEFASRRQLMHLAKDIKDEIARLTDSYRLGNAIKSGIPIAIIGATNAGKSSLLNALSGEDRAIVSDIRGTTRDVVETALTIGSYTYRLKDTAGLRTTSDPVERLGIERTLNEIAGASIILNVIDSTDPTAAAIDQNTDATGHMIIVVNKTDLTPSPRLHETIKALTDKYPEANTMHVSATTGEGIKELAAAIEAITAAQADTADQTPVTNARHYQALLRASESIRRVINGINEQLSGELIAQDLRDTTDALGEILGTITTPDLLSAIFTRFCIGK